MAERIKQESFISLEEVLRTEILFNKVLIDILLTNRIISEEDLVKIIRKIRHEQMEMLN